MGTPYGVKLGLGILLAVENELGGGWHFTGLVAAEIFSDYLEMAGHLLAEGYKDAAAVLSGSTLEEHLRRLATANRIPHDYTDKHGALVRKKAESLNAELAKAGAYNLLDQKNVTGWLDLRNNAAHGRYTEYSREQVDLLIRGVSEFIARTPA